MRNTSEDQMWQRCNRRVSFPLPSGRVSPIDEDLGKNRNIDQANKQLSGRHKSRWGGRNTPLRTVLRTL